jgi:ADP-heptose:LPS heptosyltransferase
VGFGHFRHRAAYNVRIPRAQEILGVERTVHTAEHLASAMFHLGAPVGAIPRAKLAVGPGGGAGGHTAVIHAVAAAPEKTWRTDGFLAVAEHLKQTGLEPVFIGGAADDLAPFRAYRTMAGAPLSEIKALLAGAELFVGNDSGPAHMAAALGVPSVVVFGPTDPAIWGPWRTVSKVIQSPEGIARVKVADVLDAVAGLKAAA